MAARLLCFRHSDAGARGNDKHVKPNYGAAEMSKDFDLWNTQKKKADAGEKRAFFKEREIWWCRLGINIGDEQDGKGALYARPMLVFRKFNHHIFLGIPLSTQIKENRFYYHFPFKGKEQSLLLSQLRLIDAKRFVNKVGEIPKKEMEAVRQKLMQLLF